MTDSPSRSDLEVENIVRALRSYGVLRRSALVDVCGAGHWSDAGFRRALDRAVAGGRVRRLGADFYEISEPPVAWSTGWSRVPPARVLGG